MPRKKRRLTKMPEGVEHMHIVIICGGRDLCLTPAHYQWLNALHGEYGLIEVIVGSDNRYASGALRGVDAQALAWAKRQRIDTTVMEANWERHGRSAGPVRNGRMLTYLCLIEATFQYQSAVIAFPGGSGTAHMIACARKANVVVFQFPG